MFLFSMRAEIAVWLTIVAALWGATNPFLKRGSYGLEYIKGDNVLLQFIREFKFLFLQIQVAILLCCLILF